MLRDDHGSSRGVPDRESGPSEPGTFGERVHVITFGWQKSVGRIARLSAPGGRKASWSEKTLARRKPEALPDAGHGWREGETVRQRARSALKVLRAPGLQVKACRLSMRRKALSGFRASGPHGSGVSESFDSQVNSRGILRKERRHGQRIGRYGDRLGRACG